MPYRRTYPRLRRYPRLTYFTRRLSPEQREFFRNWRSERYRRQREYAALVAAAVPVLGRLRQAAARARYRHLYSRERFNG